MNSGGAAGGAAVLAGRTTPHLLLCCAGAVLFALPVSSASSRDKRLLSRVSASAICLPCAGVNETDRAFLQRQLSKGLRRRKPRTEFAHATSASKRSEQRRFLAFIRCHSEAVACRLVLCMSVASTKCS